MGVPATAGRCVRINLRTMRRAKVLIPLGVLLVAALVLAAKYGTFRDEPTELVAGVNEPPPPRVSADYAGLDIKALDAAADYAAEHDSSALIVWRRGHIAFEKYWDGTDFNTLLDTGEFSATLGALLAGVAQADRKLGPVEGDATLSDLLRSRDDADVQRLRLVIERATGQPYAQYLSAQLWKRIGAGDARLRECCLIARQGDWIRVGELLVSDGRYQAEEIVPPGWVARILPRTADAPRAGEPYAARDMFFLAGFGKNRLWLVPSLGLVILRTGMNRADAGDWDDARIPNLVIRGASDFKPGVAASGLESLVPNH
jgi:hypothetical protein